MTQIKLKLTATELQILTGLAADQLFRNEFIDSRRPGFRSNGPELSIGKQLVQRMKLAAGLPPTARDSGVAPIVQTTGRDTA